MNTLVWKAVASAAYDNCRLHCVFWLSGTCLSFNRPFHPLGGFLFFRLFAFRICVCGIFYPFFWPFIDIVNVIVAIWVVVVFRSFAFFPIFSFVFLFYIRILCSAFLFLFYLIAICFLLAGATFAAAHFKFSFFWHFYDVYIMTSRAGKVCAYVYVCVYVECPNVFVLSFLAENWWQAENQLFVCSLIDV